MTENTSAFPITDLLKAHAKDLGGGFVVRRLLPAVQRQAVGPFIFFDHFGPVTVTPADNHDVRPHPHIGLATITYLFDGVIMHRDNLGYAQRIEPGAINLMIAGNGIVHSERKPEEQKNQTYVNHGLQLWIAVPEEMEAINSSFSHTPAAAIPELNIGAAQVRVLVGSAFGATSPVPTLSPTLYLDVQLPANSSWQLPMLADEQAIYPISGHTEVDDKTIEDGNMLVMHQLRAIRSGEDGARFVVIGGKNLGKRLMWWNFVASSKEAIDAAAVIWESAPTEGSLKQVPGEVERIPLPQR
ncbi:pirin family protein [Undibacterium sp. LX40W]|uniref:Pirin family protein n=1 Tax=Undibacterium nitidum TaxID=2762298 RepID=A0A923HJP7_9BURK|nr:MULTISPECIES: pirin family protein [Undibacterium]MBC3880930.1 pirin family protein [Undibacterium nitidum]MBC3890337.1 pirin family protein [Undibacterium sp. LX40W]